MRRPWGTTTVVLVALSFVLAACGGSSDGTSDAAAPAPTDPPTTTASPSPKPTPTQPRGASGVTYKIQNFDDYADDPAVLAWKTTSEAIAGSANKRTILPAMRRGLDKKTLRVFVASVSQARKKDWHLKSTAYAKVESAETKGRTARLAMCVWGPSVVFYQKNGKVFGEQENYWSKQDVTLTSSGGRWVMTSFAYDGKCAGGAPA